MTHPHRPCLFKCCIAAKRAEHGALCSPACRQPDREVCVLFSCSVAQKRSQMLTLITSQVGRRGRRIFSGTSFFTLPRKANATAQTANKYPLHLLAQTTLATNCFHYVSTLSLFLSSLSMVKGHVPKNTKKYRSKDVQSRLFLRILILRPLSRADIHKGTFARSCYEAENEFLLSSFSSSVFCSRRKMHH